MNFTHILIVICLSKGALLTLFDDVRFSRLLEGFVFHNIAGVSLSECWTQCEQRPSCKSINYRRRFQSCFLNSKNDDGDNAKWLVEAVGFVYKPKKNDPTKIQICGERSCSEGEVCNGTKCEVQECPALPKPASNQTVLGNMFSRGNKLILKCREGYIWKNGNDVTSSQCLNNGTWSSTMNCTKGINPVKAQCVMDVDGGGWTVIQRRESASNFYRGWQDYRDGFGDETNFWLGLKNIYRLTAQGNYELRIDMKKRDDGRSAAAKYSNFSVGNESSGFRLFVAGYSFDPSLIDPGESLIEWHNGMKFSTYDNDNDVNIAGGNCAINYQGAWWYMSCHRAHLNGVYGNTNTPSGIVWLSFTGYYGSLSYTRMMIRPKRI